MQIKPFLLASASSLALLAAPSAARAACLTSGTDQTCTNATTIGGITTSGVLDLTNTLTGVVDGAVNGSDFAIADTSASDSTTIDNAGTLTGTARVLNLQGALTLTNRAGASLESDSGRAINSTYAGLSTIVNDGTIESGDHAIDMLEGSLDLTNSGRIISNAAYAVFAGGDLTVSNTGTIEGYSRGVYAVGDLLLDNTGTIASAIYGGPAVETHGGTNTISNSGSISGAYGIFANNDIVGDASLTVTNSGTIQGGYYGIWSYDRSTAITNSGSITGDYYGIFAYNDDASASLALTNSGTISGYYGVFSQVASTTIDNSGSIGGAGGYAIYGVYAYGSTADSSLALTNSGTISGYYGVFSQVASTTIDNSGSIGGAGGYAIYGVYAYGSTADSSLALTNSGTISGYYGVFSQVASTTIDNSGTIAGSNYGIYSLGMLTLANTGLIAGGSASVLLNANGNSLTLDKGARFDGVIDYADTTGNTTRFSRGSWILDVANYDAADNTIVTGGSAYVVKGNQIIVADGSAVQASARSALDITRSLSGLASDALSLSSSSLPVASSSGGALAYADDNAVDRGFTSAALTGSGQENAFSRFSNGAVGDAAGNIVWSRVFAGRSVASQDAASADSWMNFVGAAFGGDHRFSDTLRLGGFFGLADSRTETDSNSSLKSKWYYAGLYGSWSPGAAFVEGNLTGGYADNRSERLVANGLATETASGEYGSTFVSPELAVGYRVALQPGVSLTPQLRVRYLGVDAEGYGETGSSADMTVSSHYSGFLEERALAKLGFDNERWSLFTTLGVVALQRVQGSGTDVSLLGIASTVAEGDSNLFGVSFGLGGNWKMTDTVSLYGAINGTALDNNASIDTNVGVKMVF